MSEFTKVCESIAATVADYRATEQDAIDADHVSNWSSQFPEGARLPMLTELDYVLKKTYKSKNEVRHFLGQLVDLKKLAGDRPETFWRSAGILNIQQSGHSQCEMLAMMDEILEEKYHFTTADADGQSGTFIYLDDVVFSGGHVRNDLSRWIATDAPAQSDVHIIVLAYHLGGQYFAKGQIAKAASQHGKVVRVHWWRITEIENRKTYLNNSDVLAPTRIPDHQRTRDYVQMLTDAGYPPTLRKAGAVGPAKFFSSEAGRDALEQNFLTTGVEIRDLCPNLNDYQRPLGNMVLQTLGFGALIVTFRNCPNNCPLAFWVDDPWYPLFRRKIN